MRHWLAAFPREDLLVVRLEDYARRSATGAPPHEHPSHDGGPTGRTGVARVLTALQRHLGLGPPGDGAWAEMRAAPVTRGSPPAERNPARVSPDKIDPVVRAALREFYDPFDRELEQLLGAPGFADWHSDAWFV
jgi:hypothetical protein